MNYELLFGERVSASVRGIRKRISRLTLEMTAWGNVCSLKTSFPFTHSLKASGSTWGFLAERREINGIICQYDNVAIISRVGIPGRGICKGFMNYELFGVGTGLALHAETETMLLFQTVTHPQPPLKRGVSAIAHGKRISPLGEAEQFIIHN
jgi:hypothetical protein